MKIITSPYQFFNTNKIPTPKTLEDKPKNRMLNIPTEFWIRSGYGESNISPLSSFDKALIKAEIGHINLVPYSSIIPRFARYIEDNINIFPGSETGVIIASQTGIKNDIIISGLAVGVCRDYYVVYETHEKNKNISMVHDNLVKAVKEAIKERGGNPKELLVILEQKEVNSNYGTIVSAIIFNPVSYL